MYYRLETFDKDGKIIDSKHVEFSVGTAEDVLREKVVKTLKDKAKQMGYGFRVKREDD